MPTLTKGSFSINLGLIKLSGDLSEEDRQCAWELYTELSTRVAVIGKSTDDTCEEFEGELYIESLDSLYSFFKESRGIMRKFPVGRIQGNSKNHLGALINGIMSGVLRPFLEKWQIEYRHWWECESNPRLQPLSRQQDFPKTKELLSDWTNLRLLMRGVQDKIVTTYKLVDVTT